MIRASEVVATIDTAIKYHKEQEGQHDYHKGAIDTLEILRKYIIDIDQYGNWWIEEMVEWGKGIIEFAEEQKED